MLPQIPITNPLLHAFRWATSKNLSDVWRGIAIPWICHPLKLSLSLYNQGGGVRYFLPKQKNIFLAIPCDLFGMVKCDPFKGESWPPTIGDKESSPIEITWISLSQVPVFPPKGFPQKKHQRYVTLRYSDSHFDHWVPRDPKQPSASWDPKTWRVRPRKRGEPPPASRKVPKLDRSCDNQWAVLFPSWTW